MKIKIPKRARVFKTEEKIEKGKRYPPNRRIFFSKQPRQQNC